MTTLTYAKSRKLWATAFAGINSSAAERQRGQNEHLRSFNLHLPQRLKEATEKEKEQAAEHKVGIEFLGKASLFTTSTAPVKETYQRILRLSRYKPNGGSRIGAVATGLAPQGEIVLFDADTNRPGPDGICGRITLEKQDEAADLDIIDLEDSEAHKDGTFRVAYCTDYDIYVTDVDSRKKDKVEPRCILSTPHPGAFASSKLRPKLRSTRFITQHKLLVLQNKPKSSGAELFLLDTSGMVTVRKKLHRGIKSAISLSTAHLDASSPSEIDQHAIAVAGADTSITILTLDRFISSPKGRVKFRSHSFFPSVHSTSITSLAFSNFKPPTTDWNATPVQYLKLASTSIANTCVVQTFPLSPYPSPPKPNTPARYLLTPPARSNLAQNTFSTIVAIIAIAIGAFFLQAFTEIRGGVPEYLGAKGWLSERVHGWIARPYMFEEGYANAMVDRYSEAFSEATQAAGNPVRVTRNAATEGEQSGLRYLLAQRNLGDDTVDNANDEHEIVISNSPKSDDEDNGVSANLVHTKDLETKHQRTKKWEDLAEHEKQAWKKRLIDAGHWTAEEGEAVLKGVLFSGLANVVGGIVGG